MSDTPAAPLRFAVVAGQVLDRHTDTRLERLRAQLDLGRIDHVAVLGGMCKAPELARVLDALAAGMGRPTSIVLSPREHQGSNLAQVRAETAVRVRTCPTLSWPGMGMVVPLGPGRALVGHGGWGDCRQGELTRADDPRFEGIRELEGLTVESLRQRLLRLGADAALVMRAALRQAAVRHWAVEVILHHAPVEELIPGGSPQELALGVCGALGRVLREAGEQFPEVRFRAWCPSLAGQRVRIQLRENVDLVAVPDGIELVELPPLEPRARPGDAGNPVPLLPEEEAATVAVTRDSLRVMDELESALEVQRPGPRLLTELLFELAAQPEDSAYPLPAGTTPDQWSRELGDAVETLVGQRLLGAEDESGVALSEWLGALLLGPIAPSLEQCIGRRRLVGELVQNIASPGRINQGHKGTCAVTCVEVWLAERRPAELCRLVAGLARPEGQVLLYNGETMLRDEERHVWAEREARRSPVSRLFQVAAMEYAYPDADYRNDEDAHFEVNTAGVELSSGTGLGLTAFDRLLEGVTGRTWRTLSERDTAMAEAFAKLGLDTSFLPRVDRDGEGIMRRCVAAGAGCFVTLEPRSARNTAATRRAGESWQHLPHKVRVLRFEDESDRVYYEDPFDPEHPWIPDVETRIEDPFGTCSMGRADFLALMVELSFEPRFAP